MKTRIATFALAALLAIATAAPAQQQVWEALDQLDRRVAGMLRIGTVHEIDRDSARLRVRLGEATGGGDFTTGWIPWPHYMTPQKGQLALVACPSGNLRLATLVSLLPFPEAPPGQ